MFNSLGKSRISPSSASFGVEIESFNIVLIMVNCICVRFLISSLLMYQVSHPYQSTGSIVVWYTFISILLSAGLFALSPWYFISVLIEYALLPTIIFEFSVIQLFKYCC